MNLPPASSPPDEREALPPSVRMLFAPADKAAFGVAVGLTAGLGVCLITVASLVLRPEPPVNLGLLAHYFRGYTVSWVGALVGFAWAFMAGFCAGWFAAFSRNFFLAGWLFVTRTRQEMAATRDFLDHI